LQSAAIERNTSFNPGIVRELEIVIPAGHAGVTGIAIAQAHQVVIPATGNVWIIGDDEVIRWPLDGYANSGQWSAFVYNTDFANPHSWYVRWLIDEISLTLPVTPRPALNPFAIQQAATNIAPSIQGL
jgi:hypothetical protein